MKILFILPNKKLIPSSIVRVMSWQTYLDNHIHAAKRFINYESSFLIKLGDFLADSNGCKKHPHLQSALFRLLFFLNFIYKNIFYYQLRHSAGHYDIYFFQWATIPGKYLEEIIKKGTRIVYDFDDAVFIKKPEETEFMIRHAHQVIAGSHFLFDYAQQLNRSTILLPGAVDLENFKPASIKRNRLCIGWIGSRSTAQYLDMVASPLNNLKKKGYDFDLLIAGCKPNFTIANISSETNTVVIPSYQNNDIPTILSGIDIGIMPLQDSLWEKGKSAMKAILYMAAAKPVIASHVGESVYLIKNNVTGFLVRNSDEWETILAKLLDDADLREKIGRAGRVYVEKNHSLKDYYDKLSMHVFKNYLPH
jgi:glycosyltransferase involved in cell wall biosynthesis